MSQGDQYHWTMNAGSLTVTDANTWVDYDTITAGSTGTTTVWWEPSEEYKIYVETIKGERKHLPIPYPNSPESKYLEKDPIKEGVEMKKLYEVIAVYGEDRKVPLVLEAPMVVADSDEEAKLRSGIYELVKTNLVDYDIDYLTIICRVIGEVKIKERAKEVKQV